MVYSHLNKLLPIYFFTLSINMLNELNFFYLFRANISERVQIYNPFFNHPKLFDLFLKKTTFGVLMNFSLIIRAAKHQAGANIKWFLVLTKKKRGLF